MNKKIFTIGEIMLRISPYNQGKRIQQSELFRIVPGGSESNVAICLAQLGHKVGFLTSLPNNYMTALILRYLRQYNVDTLGIHIRKEGRVGLYWTEYGIGPRPAEIIYDRDNSSFSYIRHDDFNLDMINRAGYWIHASGINTALSEKSCSGILSILARISIGMRISIDLNYRSKLWGWVKRNDRKKVRTVMEKLCRRAYLITGNENDLQNCFGFANLYPDDIDSYEKAVKSIFNRIRSLRYVAISLRTSHSASDNDWSGVLFVKNGQKINRFVGPCYKITNIVDRVGVGDSFAGGIIHGILRFGDNFQRTVDFATTIGALNHTILGDASQFSNEDVEKVLALKGSGLIIR